jgi:hypothetical protein
VGEASSASRRPSGDVPSSSETEDSLSGNGKRGKGRGKRHKIKNKRREQEREKTATEQVKAIDPLEVAVQEAVERKAREVGYPTEPPERTPGPEAAAPKQGFWGRLLGKKARVETVEAPAPEVVAEVDAIPYQGETRVASVDIPSVAANGQDNPVVIERRVQIPITLGPEEVLRGARLRLVMEIRVAASQPAPGQGDVSKVA